MVMAPLRPGILSFQIGVVGDGHELGKAWPATEGVVDTREVDHLEGERLLAEVVRLAQGAPLPSSG